MPGISSGLAPHMVFENKNDWSAEDREFVAMCKFPVQSTVLDWFGIMQTAMTTENSTTHIREIIQDGATTGSGTTSVGNILGTWVAYTGKSRGTNYTFSANEWARIAFSENGTADASQTSAGLHAVYGSV